MRNGFLGSLVVLLFAGSVAPAQAPGALGGPLPGPAAEEPWQPPRTDLDDRPNATPKGYQFYGSVDYILWWTEKDRPVSTQNAGPGTTDLGALVRNGERGTLGMWLDPQQSIGLELGGFWTVDREPGEKYQIDDVGVHSQLHSQFSGAEAQVRAEIYRGTWAHVDFLGGFRYLGFDEGMNIAQRDSNTSAVTADGIGTRNRFYGGQAGTEMELHYDKCFLDLWGKVGLGVDDQTINVNGTTLAAGQASPGGALVPAGLIGRYRRDDFAVLPEFGCNIGYHLTQHLRVTVGYTLFFLTDTVRPGEQFDSLEHSPRASVFPVQTSDFWVQGLNLGLEFRF